MNPLLDPWTTPFELPPFDRIEDDQFAPAFEAAFSEARAEIAAIAENPEPPSFENTIVAMERPGALERVAGVFFNLSSADSNPAREALQRDLSPKFAALHAETMMNAALFARVEVVHEARAELPSDAARVAELYHRMFVRAGAKLTGADRDRLKAVLERLAALGTEFTQNVLAEERDWALPLDEGDAALLPGFLQSALSEAAKGRGEVGHTLTLSPSVVEPFLASMPERALRETAYKAWKARGQQGGKGDNAAITAEILALREERAKLLGHENFAAFKLETEMAKTPGAVRDLLTAVWEPARVRAEEDRSVLEALMAEDGVNAAFAPWDWAYYAEKRRKRDFDIDEAEVKPYLSLDAMIAASFGCATRLFGLSFREVDLPLYHPDCRAWEVTKGDRHMGIFIGDYFARPSKRSGAWCSRFRAQSNLDQDVRPLVVNVCNFAKAPAGEPSLLSFDDARTLFHEFGHALHTLLSDQRFPFISGTSVARDFVELPSQLYEHWLSVPSVLAEHARHVDTGEPMPADMVKRLKAAENADQGFATVSYVSSALVDLDLHAGPAPADVGAAEAETLARIAMPDGIEPRHMAAHFKHIFSGDGYSSGYYSYMWSEVMDADAFSAFEEEGDPFHQGTAAKLAEHVYSAGGSRDEQELYTAFRGAMPGVDALLKKRGFLAA